MAEFTTAGRGSSPPHAVQPIRPLPHEQLGKRGVLFRPIAQWKFARQSCVRRAAVDGAPCCELSCQNLGEFASGIRSGRGWTGGHQPVSGRATCSYRRMGNAFDHQHGPPHSQRRPNVGRLQRSCCVTRAQGERHQRRSMASYHPRRRCKCGVRAWRREPRALEPEPPREARVAAQRLGPSRLARGLDAAARERADAPQCLARRHHLGLGHPREATGPDIRASQGQSARFARLPSGSDDDRSRAGDE
mmetsp:Transcript_58861/g.138388  ORF Transcript_58861/g.138388 Transcript_58861/m.138388 type:complete len:247 (+) Transcript_58861:204-944(+)